MPKKKAKLPDELITPLKSWLLLENPQYQSIGLRDELDGKVAALFDYYNTSLDMSVSDWDDGVHRLLKLLVADYAPWLLRVGLPNDAEYSWRLVVAIVREHLPGFKTHPEVPRKGPVGTYSNHEAEFVEVVKLIQKYGRGRLSQDVACEILQRWGNPDEQRLAHAPSEVKQRIERFVRTALGDGLNVCDRFREAQRKVKTGVPYQFEVAEYLPITVTNLLLEVHHQKSRQLAVARLSECALYRERSGAARITPLFEDEPAMLFYPKHLDSALITSLFDDEPIKNLSED